MEKEIRDAVFRLQRIDEELGNASEDNDSEDHKEEEPYNFSRRILLSDIQELKTIISQRDKESLICTNRRKVIELNALIYRKMKQIMEIYNQAEKSLHKDIKSKRGIKKNKEKEISEQEETLAIILAQIKQLQEKAEENHATEKFIEAHGDDHLLPILTVLPNSPMPYADDKYDVKEAIEYAEEELTEKQKASLQMYEKNKYSIDKILLALSDGLTDLKDHANMMGDEINQQNLYLSELDNVIDDTTDHIQRNRETLQRHSVSSNNKNCGMYLCCVVIILIIVIVILNLLKNLFS